MRATTILGIGLLAALLAVTSQQALSRGGGGGGGHGGGFGGYGGGERGGGEDAWHAGGVDAVGGTWHNDGYHADAYWAGYAGAAAVNNAYNHGCYDCGPGPGWGAPAMATGYPIGTTVVTPPSSQDCQNVTIVGVKYYVCGSTWFKPYVGNNGLYYKVVKKPT